MIKKIVNSIIFVFLIVFFYGTSVSRATYQVDVHSITELYTTSSATVSDTFYIDSADYYKMKIKATKSGATATTAKEIQVVAYSTSTGAKDYSVGSIHETNVTMSVASSGVLTSSDLYLNIVKVPENHSKLVLYITVTMNDGVKYTKSKSYNIKRQINDTEGTLPPDTTSFSVYTMQEITNSSGSTVTITDSVALDTLDDFRYKLKMTSTGSHSSIKQIDFSAYTGKSSGSRDNLITGEVGTALRLTSGITPYMPFTVFNVNSKHTVLTCDFKITLNGDRIFFLTKEYTIKFNKNDETGGNPPSNNPPTLSYTLSPTTQAASVTIKVTAKDDRAVDYIVDPSGKKTYATTVSYAVTSNGSYKFTAYDIDGASKSLTVSVTNVNNPPTLSHTLSPTTQAVSVTIKVTAKDDKGINYIVNPAGTKTYSSTVSYTVTSNGNYKFTAYDTDGASKSLTVSVTNIVPNQPPSISHTLSTTSDTPSVVITVTATDDYGIDYIQKPDSSKVYATKTTYTVTANGTYTFIAYDIYGASKTLSVKITNIVAALTLNLSNSTSASTNGSITITATANSGYGINYIFLPNGNKIYSTTATYSVSSNGKFSFVAIDNRERIITKTISIQNIDKNKPTISLSSNPNKDWNNKDVKITINTSD